MKQVEISTDIIVARMNKQLILLHSSSPSMVNVITYMYLSLDTPLHVFLP